jgi:hypothetical protein
MSRQRGEPRHQRRAKQMLKGQHPGPVEVQMDPDPAQQQHDVDEERQV